MALDLSDPYQTYAFFAVEFICLGCNRLLEVASKHESPSDEWCVDAARQARVAGWYVPPENGNGLKDIETCYCPECARDRGLPAA